MRAFSTIVLVSLLLAAGARAQDCSIPPAYLNQASVVTSNNLWVGFATDKHNYMLGDTARFYLVVKNIGTETFDIWWGTDPMDGVFVLPEGCTDINQPGCIPEEDYPVFSWPWVIYMYSDGTTLLPGQCRVWHDAYWPIATWQGGAEPGTYSVLGGMYKPPYFSIHPHGEFVVPPGGVLLSLTILDPTATRSATWGAIKGFYRE